MAKEQDQHRKAFALIICLFLAYMYVETLWKPYFYGYPAQQAPQTAATPAPTASRETAGKQFLEAASTPTTTSSSETTQSAAAPSAPSTPYPDDLTIRNAGSIIVRNEVFELEISLLGGRILRASLLEYSADSSNPDVAGRLNLVTHTEYGPHPLGLYAGAANDAWVRYVAEGARDGELEVSSQTGAKPLVLKGLLADGRTIIKRLEINPSSYLFTFNAQVDSANSTEPLALEWTEYVPEDESSFFDPYAVEQYVWYQADDNSDRLPYSDLEENRQTLENLRWLGMTDKYFLRGLISEDDARKGALVKTDTLYRAKVFGEPSQISLSVFVGPKKWLLLEDLGYELTRSVDFGMFGFVSAPLLSLLRGLYAFFGNWGLSIVVLTIIVRMAMYPLNAAQFKSMKALQELKPELDRIKEQVKDKQKQQMELMALYKKRGVNPLGGCLPVLLQMPIFIGLYSALIAAVELRGAPFALWIKDLSAPESLELGGIGLPVMVILLVISMLIQQWTTPTTMDPAQKRAMLIMPVVLGFMFASFPAGLALYWLTNNLISIGQQKGMYRMDDKGGSALMITSAVCVVVFGVAYTVTLF